MDTWTQASTKTVNGLEKRQSIIQSKFSRQRNSLRKFFVVVKLKTVLREDLVWMFGQNLNLYGTKKQEL